MAAAMIHQLKKIELVCTSGCPPLSPFVPLRTPAYCRMLLTFRADLPPQFVVPQTIFGNVFTDMYRGVFY
jgi:hypothetical protein